MRLWKQRRKDERAAERREQARKAKREAFRNWVREMTRRVVIQLRQAVLDILMTVRAQAQYAAIRARMGRQVGGVPAYSGHGTS